MEKTIDSKLSSLKSSPAQLEEDRKKQEKKRVEMVMQANALADAHTHQEMDLESECDGEFFSVNSQRDARIALRALTAATKEIGCESHFDLYRHDDSFGNRGLYFAGYAVCKEKHTFEVSCKSGVFTNYEPRILIDSKVIF